MALSGRTLLITVLLLTGCAAIAVKRPHGRLHHHRQTLRARVTHVRFQQRLQIPRPLPAETRHGFPPLRQCETLTLPGHRHQRLPGPTRKFSRMYKWNISFSTATSCAPSRIVRSGVSTRPARPGYCIPACRPSDPSGQARACSDVKTNQCICRRRHANLSTT